LTSPARRRKRLKVAIMNEAVSPPLDGVSISASAARRLNAILKGEDGAALRISVRGGGCSGFQYAFDVERSRADDDVAVTRDGATVLVDPVSLEMLKGAELDFVDDLMGQSFRVKNPNAVASCGCGVSFSV
jgi:iron-sulfur cluster insertion protein